MIQTPEDSLFSLDCLKKIDLSSSGPQLKNLFNKLTEGFYTSIILGERSIIVPYYINEEGVVERKKRVFNLSSQTSYYCDYLEYPIDSYLDD